MTNADSSTQTKDRHAVWLRGAALALSLILYRVFLTLESEGEFARFFSDFDETLYIRYHLNIGSIPWTDLVERLPKETHGLSVIMPHLLVDVLLGQIHSFLNLHPATILIYLDFIAVFFSYPIFVKFFSELPLNTKLAEVTTLLCLCFPFAFYLPGLIGDITFPIGITEPFSEWISLPAHRGIYTQVSYPFVALSLLWSLRAFRGERKNYAPYMAGLFTGTLLYLYFFAFVAIGGVVGIYILLQSIRSRKPITLISFVLTAFLVASPGLILIALTNSSDLMNIPEFCLHIPYLNPVLLLEVVLLGCALFIFRKSNSKFNILLFCFSNQLALLFTVNLQVFISKNITAYHIPVFYLIPIASALYVALFASELRPKFIKILYTFLFIAAFIVQSVKAHRNQFVQHDIDDVVNCVAKVPETFWQFPFALTLESEKGLFWEVEPYAIAALSKRNNRELEMAIVNYEEFIKIESVYSWLLNGRPQLIAYCPEETVSYPNFYTSFYDWQLIQRKELCRYADKVDMKQLFCSEIKERKSELFIWREKTEFQSQDSPFVSELELCKGKGVYLINFPQIFKSYCNENST